MRARQRRIRSPCLPRAYGECQLHSNRIDLLRADIGPYRTGKRPGCLSRPIPLVVRAGQYMAGATVNLSGAVPTSGWQIAGWTGTNNDASTANTNIVTMPAATRTVSVNYTEISTTCYALTLSHTGQGSDPVASPANSTGCSAGQYLAGATVNLSGAVPATGWQITEWAGTNNDESTASTNVVTMPAGAHTASVNYIGVPSPIGDIGANYDPIYAWDKITAATWYRLYVVGPSGVILDQWYQASSVCGDIFCSVIPGPSITLSGGNHAWYVQSYSASGYGPWSARTDFNTAIPTAPGAAVLTAPKGDIGATIPRAIPGARWIRQPTIACMSVVRTAWSYSINGINLPTFAML